MKRCISVLLLCMGATLLASCARQDSDDATNNADGDAADPASLALATGTNGTAAAAAPAQFLALSDVHFGLDADDSCFKGFGCETSSTLWDSAIAEATKMASDPNVGFILYTGDLPAHSEPVAVRESEFKTVFAGLAKIASGSGKRLLYLPGNNDSVGGDYCSFTSSGDTPFNFAPDPGNWPVFKGAKDIIDKSGLAYGYYSAYPLGEPGSGATEPQLRVIALNTVMFTQHYVDWCTGTMTEMEQQKRAKVQIDWLDGQLKAAKSARTDGSGNTVSDKVIIAMHVPPGTDGYGTSEGDKYVTEWRSDLDYSTGVWVQKKFLEIVNGHTDVITGLVSAHTHLNGIRRIDNCNGDFVELDMSVPAVTTDHGSNPALRLVTYDGDFEWTAASTRYATQSSQQDPNDPNKTIYSYHWSNDFSFADNYPCPGCDGSETLQQRIAKIDDSSLLNDMLTYLTVEKGSHSPRMYRYALDTQCSPDQPGS